MDVVVAENEAICVGKSNKDSTAVKRVLGIPLNSRLGFILSFIIIWVFAQCTISTSYSIIMTTPARRFG
jgi:hypothetical protein